MKKEIYIRPCCNVLILEHLCNTTTLPMYSGQGDEKQMSKEHSFTLEEETTTRWENE